MSARPASRWSQNVIDAEIAELERLLLVLPSEYEYRWHTSHIHRQIKAQLEVLRTGWIEDNYKFDDAADAALWAMQWLYKKVDGMFSALKLRVDQGPSEEWKLDEQFLKALS